MEFRSPYWSNTTKVQLLERWILVHSYLYYELDKPIVDDYKFDANCQQLMELKKQDPVSYKESKYYYVFHDFTGSTGYGLYSHLNDEDYETIMRDVNTALRVNESHKGKGML